MSEEKNTFHKLLNIILNLPWLGLTSNDLHFVNIWSKYLFKPVRGRVPPFVLASTIFFETSRALAYAQRIVSSTISNFTAWHITSTTLRSLKKPFNSNITGNLGRFWLRYGSKGKAKKYRKYWGYRVYRDSWSPEVYKPLGWTQPATDKYVVRLANCLASYP